MKVHLIILFAFLTLVNSKSDKRTPDFIEVKSSSSIDFSKYIFNTVEGKKSKIKLEEGKIYILDFWFLECPPCVKDHKIISKNINKLKGRNVEVIGISIDKSKKNWIKYLSEHNYDWKNYNQFSYSREGLLIDDLNLRIYPTYLVVDEKGKILHKTRSFTKVLNYLSKN